MDRSSRPGDRKGIRLMPSTLGGRLVWSIVLMALVTTTVSVVVIEVLMATGRSATTTGSTGLAIRSSLLGGGLAVFVGLGLGLVLAHRIKGPVIHLVDKVKEHGAFAIEGAAAPAGDGLDDPRLPQEFRELGSVFEGLLDSLSSRQAELQAAVREAENARESLSMVVQESREAKLMIRGGRIIVANPAACTALGRSLEELLSGTANDALDGTIILDEQDEELDVETLLDRIAEGPRVVRLARGDQLPRWYVFHAASRPDSPHPYLLVTARDITEERRLEQVRAEIVSLVSHDLRAPLSVIVGYLDILRKRLKESDREHAIDSARRSAERMDVLLEDLLSATRAEQLLAPTTLSPVSLVPLASEVVTSLAQANPDTPLVLEAECSPIVRGEEGRLQQGLANLVSNALKYSGGTGGITVRISCQGDVALLQVVDHGPGISPEDRAFVFERFARLDGSLARPGVGLGLYIVRVISENHGGAVRVDETPGGGATFTIELPCTGHVVDGEPVLEMGICPRLSDPGAPVPA